MAAVNFRIQHRNHSGGVISTHTPVGESLRWAYRATDIGDISYDLSLLDDLAPKNLGENSFAPYKTDWHLQMQVGGGGWGSIQAGIHTSVNLAPREGVVTVNGKDWLHWLEQPVWFDKYNVQFDPGDLQDVLDADFAGYGNGAFYDSDYVKVWIGANGAVHQDVISHLINNAKRGSDFVNLQPVYGGVGNSWNQLFTFVIMFQDQTTILDHIKNLAQMADPYGYDFYVDWDKKIYFFGPRKQVPFSPDPIWTLTTENVVVDTVPEFDWTNNGPIATHVVGLGPGNPAIWRIKKDQDSIDLYRQWLRLENVGESYLRSTLTGTVNAIQKATEGLQFIFPHKDLNLSIYPDVVNPSDLGDGFRNHCGDVVRFKWEVYPYHTINAYFWITGQEYTLDAAGNAECALELEQIYDVFV